MDITLNELDFVIDGLPTILLFPPKNKNFIKYEGDRTIFGFSQFINEFLRLKNN